MSDFCPFRDCEHFQRGHSTCSLNSCVYEPVNYFRALSSLLTYITFDENSCSADFYELKDSCTTLMRYCENLISKRLPNS